MYCVDMLSYFSRKCNPLEAYSLIQLGWFLVMLTTQFMLKNGLKAGSDLPNCLEHHILYHLIHNERV